jgi:hypothetical protein
MGVSRRRTGALLFGTFLAATSLIVTSCGGGSDEATTDPGGSGGPTTATDPAEGSGGGSDDGGLSLGGDIPDYFPSDFYLPAGMTVKGVSRAGDTISLAGTFETGDIEAIQADMVAGLQAAGYELLTDGEIAAFAKNGVGRVRVRTSEFLDELTVSVDIDTWSDAQLDELRALVAEPVTVPGQATAQVGDNTLEAVGECTLQGTKRSFFASDASITLNIDETQDPTFVSADVTTSDGVVLSTENGADIAYESAPERISATGDMVELYNESAGTVSFSITATCDS